MTIRGDKCHFVQVDDKLYVSTNFRNVLKFIYNIQSPAKTVKTFMAEYTVNNGASYDTILVSADAKPQAILEAYLALPFGAIVTEIFEVI